MTLTELIEQLSQIAEADEDAADTLQVKTVVLDNPQGVRVIQRAS